MTIGYETRLHEYCTLACRNCGSSGVPNLKRNGGGGLGAYCSGCFAWIKWVSQHDPAWATLEQRQKAETADLPKPPLTQDAIEDPYISSDIARGITLLAQVCYTNAFAKGWLQQRRSPLETDMLIVTEVAELAEAQRAPVMQQSEHIPEFTAEEEEYADIIIRVGNHSMEHGVDPERLAEAIIAKLKYNLTRPVRHGGKKA